MSNELQWETIYYHEENDTDDSFISFEMTEQAPYRGGMLVKNTYKEDKKSAVISLIHVPHK